MDAFLRPGTRNRQMAVIGSRRRSIIVKATCGTLLAACAAASAPPSQTVSSSRLRIRPASSTLFLMHPMH